MHSSTFLWNTATMRSERVGKCLPSWMDAASTLPARMRFPCQGKGHRSGADKAIDPDGCLPYAQMSPSMKPSVNGSS